MTAKQFERKMQRYPRFIALPIIYLRFAVLVGAIALLALITAGVIYVTTLPASKKQAKQLLAQVPSTEGDQHEQIVSSSRALAQS